ncbi:MAG TPA: ABC transporter permease subunit [Trueperaceae bacterium]
MSGAAASGRRWRSVRAVVRKDLTVALASKAVTVPFVVVPVLFMLVLPLGVALLAPVVADEAGAVAELLETFSPTLLASLEGLNDAQRVVVVGIVYMLAPLYLVVPLMVASVLAADSFAGEKERKTLEVLVYSPLSDADLVLAKMLSAWLPAVGIGLGAFVVYAVTANAAAWPVMGRLFVPTAMWLVLLAWVMPAAAALGLGASVIVSARVSTFQEAYQLGGIVVLPVVALVAAQALGVIYLSVWLVAALGLVLWLAAASLLWVGARSLRRTELIARL